MKKVVSESFVLINSKSKIVMFDLSKSLLIEQFENKGKNMETGLYYICKCLQYDNSEKLERTNEYLTVL